MMERRQMTAEAPRNEKILPLPEGEKEGEGASRETVLEILRKASRGPLGQFLRAEMFAYVLWLGMPSARAGVPRSEEEMGAVKISPDVKISPETVAYLSKRYGGVLDIPIVIEPRDRRPEWRREDLERERAEPRAEIQGFEALGFRRETLERYLAEGFPQTFSSRTTASRIRYTTEHIPMPPRYNLHGNEAGHCTLSPGDPSSEIVVTVDALEEIPWPTESLLERVLPHEMAHAEDWLNAPTMDPSVRFELLYRMTVRVGQEDRLRFPYVESIQNDDPRVQLRDRAKEYFAELVGSAFALSESPRYPSMAAMSWQDALAQRLAEEFGTTPAAARNDVRTIERFLEEVDSEFDWERAAEARSRLRRELNAERLEALEMRVLEQEKDPRLLSALESLYRLEPEETADAYTIAGLDEEFLFREYGQTPRFYRALETTERAQEAQAEALLRISASLSTEGRAAFETWRGAMETLIFSRTLRWARSRNTGSFYQENLAQQAAKLDEFHRAFTLLPPEERERLIEAAEQAARIVGAGEIPLPPELAARVAELAPEWRFVRTPE